MSDSRPEELIRAEKLGDRGKVEEALEIVDKFEKKSKITPKEQLWALLLRGEVYTLKQQYKETVELGKRAYKLSTDLGMISESVQALILKTNVVFLGEIDDALNSILKAEELLNSRIKNKTDNPLKIKGSLLHMKSWIFFYKGDVNAALKSALKCLELTEKIDVKVAHAFILICLSQVYGGIGKEDTALEYGMKSLKLMEDMCFQVGMAVSLTVIGYAYYMKGDLNKTIEITKKILSIQEVSDMTTVYALSTLGYSYSLKGELSKGLRYIKQSLNLANEIEHYALKLGNMQKIGELLWRMGETNQAVNYLNQSLKLSEKGGSDLMILTPLFYMVLINLDLNLPDQAQLYLERLQDLSDQYESKLISRAYQIAKAAVLKSAGRRRSSTEAEILLRKIVKDEILYPPIHINAIILLCELLIEELSIYNNPEVLEEINPLILKLLKIAENQHSYSWLAEGKLLQAKLALIQDNFEKTKQLLTEAQRVAEVHGLSLLAQKISNEHDTVLEKIDEWDKLKKEDAPMAGRIELASFDDVLNRLQGKQTIDPPELVDEEPILLLIMDNSGTTYFNHPFVTNWDHSDLFSSFMSAFNTFMDEIFSKSIDRIKVGENTILINPIEPFLACYVIKGQSYLALQKLSRFTEAIKENIEIWQALEKSVKTSEILALDKPPALRTVINEIFTH
jgi:tetratricopeptide (TPR) repeat protein